MNSSKKKCVISFGGQYPAIELIYKSSKIFHKCNNYSGYTLGLNWNEITVHHNAQFEYHSNPKQLILDALFEAVEGEDFYPVAYKCGKRCDEFLVRSCKPALNKLFALGLCIGLANGASFYISVQFDVAVAKQTQISPPILIAQVLTQQMNNLEFHQGERCLLNLNDFGNHRNFKHITVSLSSLSTLKLICRNIYGDDDLFHNIKGLILSHNNLRSLAPLNIFAKVTFSLLDLSNNCIRSAKRLCNDLAKIKATELKLAGNPITKLPQYPNCLKPLENNFKLVDGVPFDKLYTTYTPLKYEIDIECDGLRIDWTNKSELTRFQSSEDWHAFLIPDPEGEFTKEILFDYLFISVDPNLSEFYPCYYTFESGEHRFIVRNCFDQIHHLVFTCNMELKIPELVVTNGNEEQVNTERSIAYYLRMNSSHYKLGQVDPKLAIEAATQKCFVALNRLLNLEDFQKTEGLENVIVHMSSPKIINGILSIASRKFVGNCNELRLGNNKIISFNYPGSLSLLSCLQALDMGENWIHDLNDIKSLGALPLRSLRLHGNPLCRKYNLPSEYVKAVKDIFPLLTKLDDVDLSVQPGMTMQKNFLIATDGYEFVERFLYTYLYNFETIDRRSNLLQFYTDETLYTMTCSYDMRMMSPTQYKRIAKYLTHSRNLRTMSDYSHAANSIHVGGVDIMFVQMQLPEVTHDWVSLQTDVMQYDDQLVVISVSGLLRDNGPHNPSDKELLLAFSRQFILKVDDEGLGAMGKTKRYKITNERFNVTHPTMKQRQNAFKFASCLNEVKQEEAMEKEKKEESQSVTIKEHKLLMLQDCTGLRSVWCTRLLEDANWNFENALELFLKMETRNELPDSAFV